jgi:hypothetical protein
MLEFVNALFRDYKKKKKNKNKKLSKAIVDFKSCTTRSISAKVVEGEQVILELTNTS